MVRSPDPTFKRGDADPPHQMRGAVGIERRRHVGDVSSRAGSRDALLVVGAELERAQHLQLGLRAAGRGLLIGRFRSLRGGEPVGAERLEFDHVGARPHGCFHQRERAGAVAIMVNASLGNDQGSAMHLVCAAGNRNRPLIKRLS